MLPASSESAHFPNSVHKPNADVDTCYIKPEMNGC